MELRLKPLPNTWDILVLVELNVEVEALPMAADTPVAAGASEEDPILAAVASMSADNCLADVFTTEPLSFPENADPSMLDAYRKKSSVRRHP